ncbi:unnamed protein product [Closterium sp. NIES-64]|nr:unnamed protein product [Closterium sp. NIES-64]
MPTQGSLYACEWCSNRFRSLTGLFSHKRRAGACIIAASRFISETPARGESDSEGDDDQYQSSQSDDDMLELNDGDDHGAVEPATATEQEDAVSSDDEDESDEADGASSDEEAHAAALLDGKESAPEGTFQPEDNFDTLMEAAEYGPRAVVLPLILSSDATILSGNERTRVWAVYISIANIPLRRRWLDCGKILLPMLPFAPDNTSPAEKVELFQAAMKIVLADLIVASHTRMQTMYPDARLAGLRPPGSGSYWASGANFTASEHASAMMVHLLTHVPEFVRRAGLPSQYSAAVYENAHIRTCKLPYRTSNRRQPLQAIAVHNVRAAALAQLTTALLARRRNQTALTREINKAVGGLLMYYDTVMRHAGLRPFPAWSDPIPPCALQAHTAVALPAQPTDHGHIKPHYVRAAASLHGRTAFSCVEYGSAHGQTQYERLLMLLDAERPLDDSRHEPVEVAVLQRLTPQGLDECTGCQMLGPPGYYRGLAVVPIS